MTKSFVNSWYFPLETDNLTQRVQNKNDPFWSLNLTSFSLSSFARAHECVLSSLSPDFLPGPRRKANTIIYLQYLKQEAWRVFMAEEDDLTSSEWWRSDETNTSSSRNVLSSFKNPSASPNCTRIKLYMLDSSPKRVHFVHHLVCSQRGSD